MGNSQKRATQNYRSRLNARGLSRFEVLGRNHQAGSLGPVPCIP
jgi:hypothetical protein